MDPAPIRRWNPGFIALRWRHLFWGLPLLGLLAGLAVHFLPMIRGTATGIVQIRPVPLTVASGRSFLGVSDVATMTRSDDLLGQTVLALDLPRRWRKESDVCVSELRDAINIEYIPGTALVQISVSGRSRAESAQIWDSLILYTNDHFSKIAQTEEPANIAALDALLEASKANFDAKREILEAFMRTSDLLHRSGSNNHPSDHRFLKAKSDFEKAKADLEAAQIAQIAAKMQARITEDPLIIHEAPGTPAPLTLWDTLRPLVLHSSIGLGSGMVLAVVLAYLFELLFPRKAPTL